MAAMRDVFLDYIYEQAKKDRNIVILSADFSAPSLDKYRLELPSQYIFMGISEQNMMLVAAGLALEGKKPICYAIAPFIVMRCFEQTRLYAAGMKLPITLVGVGAGISYEDSGYTHHAVEDIALMRSLPYMRIFQPCDNEDVKQMAKAALESDGPVYVRLDRYGIDRLFEGERDISHGMNIIKEPQNITIMASGGMMRTALEACEILEREKITVGLVNANILPLNQEYFIEIFKNTSNIITIEEHELAGGLGSHVLEIVSDCDLNIRVKRLGIDLSDGYYEDFGGRKELYRLNHMDVESVVKLVKSLKS